MPVRSQNAISVTELPGHAAWIDGDWKLHRIADKAGDKVRYELYDLAKDRLRENRRGGPGDRTRARHASRPACLARERHPQLERRRIIEKSLNHRGTEKKAPRITRKARIRSRGLGFLSVSSV